MAEEKSGVAPNDAAAKKPRDRSPAYPALSLKEAIEKLIPYDSYFKRHAAPNDKVGLAWGYKEKSSQAYSTLAAMKAFGLVEYGEERTSALTEDGRNYLRAQQESVKKAILKKCALQPKAIAVYWQKWGADRPPDPIALDELVLKRGFAQSGAPLFLKVYDETIAYAGLSNSDKLVDTNDRDELPPTFKVGDVVQWESGGVLQFDAKRISGVSEDRQFVFVEGSTSGLPISEVKMAEVPQTATRAKQQLPPVVTTTQSTFNQDVYTLGDEGRVILQWPEKLGKESFDELEDWIELQLKKIARINKIERKAKS